MPDLITSPFLTVFPLRPKIYLLRICYIFSLNNNRAVTLCCFGCYNHFCFLTYLRVFDGTCL